MDDDSSMCVDEIKPIIIIKPDNNHTNHADHIHLGETAYVDHHALNNRQLGTVSVEYSEDFEDIGTSFPKSRGYSENVEEGEQTIYGGYTEDFDSTAKDVTTKVSYSDDFESRPLTRQSGMSEILTARSLASLGYSEDFESHSASGIASKPTYSDDFESGPSRPTTRLSRTSEGLTARSLGSLGYSEDFESLTSPVSKPTPKPRTSLARYNYSQESFESTQASLISSESFDSTIGTESESLSDYPDKTYSNESDIPEEETSITSSYSGSTQSILVSPRKSRDLLTESPDEYTTYTDSSLESSRGEDLEPLTGAARDAKLQYLVRKIELLKLGKSQPAKVKTPAVVEKRESRHIRRYCEKKTELLRKKEGVTGFEEDKLKEPVTRWKLNEGELAQTYGISQLIISRLQAQNTLHKARKFTRAKIHEPHKCKTCREKIDEAASRDYIKHKLAIASRRLVEDKLERQLDLYSDPITMMQQGLEELPKLSDDPGEIMCRLLKPLQSAEIPKLGPNSQLTKSHLHLIAEPSSNKENGQNHSSEEQSVVMLERLQNTNFADSRPNLPTTTNVEGPRFWQDYFEPLQACPWYPNSMKTSNKSFHNDMDAAEYLSDDDGNDNPVHSNQISSGSSDG